MSRSASLPTRRYVFSVYNLWVSRHVILVVACSGNDYIELLFVAIGIHEALGGERARLALVNGRFAVGESF